MAPLLHFTNSKRVCAWLGADKSIRWTLAKHTKKSDIAPRSSCSTLVRHHPQRDESWVIIAMSSIPGKDSGGVVLDTSMGRIAFELYWKHAPKTCANFYQLAKQGFYDGIIFHRVISDFMIQTGDPTGTGSGGASIYGGAFEDEIHPELRFVGAGILAMANAGPNTNRSQFFVTLAPTPFLDGKHTIFGRVSDGMLAVREIGAAETQDDR